MHSAEDRLKAIQRRLGIAADGVLGPVTLTRLEAILDTVLPPDELSVSAPTLVVSQRALEALVGFEVSSDAFYRRHLQHPVWPKGESGVTIGIGYDLGHASSARVAEDWRGRLSMNDVAALLSVVGKKGREAEIALAEVAHIEVPLEAAKAVFYTSTLPRYAEKTRKAYPGIEKLPADAQGALLSLVFNRGTSMADKDSRKEMRALRALVEAGDLGAIAREIRAMKRLWDPEILGGLHTRRDDESLLVQESDRTYAPEELVSL